jgi:MFS family permease
LPPAQQASLPAPPFARATASFHDLKLSGRSDFWRLWLVGLIVFSVRWLETVAVAVVVYQRTGSPFLVATVTMLRMLPMGVFGAFIGAWAERIERRSALIGVVLMMASSSLTLAVLAYAGRLEIWHLAVASFINGIAWATDNPVRRVMIGEVVGADQMSTAMSLDVGANNASRMLGPTVGGLMLATVGIAGAFTLSVALYAIALAAALRVRYRNAALPADSAAVLARIAEGFALVRGNPRLIGVLTVTVIYNLFGWPFTSMVPVIGHDQLGLGPEGVGILASMDGVGAFCGAILAAVYLRPAWYARVFLGGSAIYMVMLIVFALTPWPLVAGAVLLFTGLGGAGFSIMQATLVYLAAPPDMRSRLLGVLSVCIGVGPIGFLLLGLEADWVGAPAATVATGVVGLAMLAATRRWWRGM